MKSARLILPVLGFGALAVLLIGVFSRVLDMRFSSGEIYPHYSTQRSDPLGARALFDSFDRIDSFTVSRNITPLSRKNSFGDETALFLLGVPRSSIRSIRVRDDSPFLHAVEKEGARLILTIDPGAVPGAYTPVKDREEKDWFDRRRELLEKRAAEKKEAEEAKLKEETKAEDEAVEDGGTKDEDAVAEEDVDEKEKPIKDERDKVEKKIDEWLEHDEEEFERETRERFGLPILEQLGLEFGDPKSYERPDDGWETVSGAGAKSAGAPSVLPNWHSQFRLQFLEDSEGDWNVIGEVDGDPVLIERKLGKGSIVVATDSFFASNEALHKGVGSEFLLWLVGDKRDLVFDETIHGTTQGGGAMKLIKRYRLHGFFIGLFVLVLLWAWRSATSLAPGNEMIDRGLLNDGAAVTGEESNSGLVRLLQRSIPSKDLLARCEATWRGSKQVNLKPQQEAELAQILAANKANPKSLDPVSAYRKVTELLRRRV